MKRLALVLLFLPVLGMPAGCGMSDEQGIIMAAGSYSDLAVVISDPRSEPLAKRFVEKLNTTTVFVIHEEPLFRSDLYQPEHMDMAKRYKNVVLLVRIGDGGPVEKRVKSMVNKETWQKLQSGTAGIVRLDDPWATYQTVLIMAHRDRNSLGSFLVKQAVAIRGILEKSNDERIMRGFRHKGLDTRLMNAYRAQFGFSFEIPKVFAQNQLKPNGFPGLELEQKSPPRGISVSWLEHDDPVTALNDQDLLLEMRQEMGTRLHSENVLDFSLRWSREPLNGLSAVKVEGSWESTLGPKGGPFWSYFVADEARGRIICVDLLVFAPNVDKMPMFRKMNAIAQTFEFVD